MHLILRRDGKMLFGQRQNTGFEDGAWHLPSGHLEAGESVVEALIREAREEIGVRIAPQNVHFSHVMHNASSGGRIAFFFVVDTWNDEPVNREPEKCAAIEWFHLGELPDRMIPYCRAALDGVAAGEKFSVFGW
ncbi:NUDIX domain-containing protein [Nocardia sp. NPDC051321]|uniref:NUDIX hydrolase n=1 Tax=Nocardia sp. NPDC051321 TaxID=3364323 RepID=UPI00379210B0